MRARSQVRIHGFRENPRGYEFVLEAPRPVRGMSLMIPSTKSGQTVQINGRTVAAHPKRVRERDYLFVTEDFEGTNRVRIGAQ